MADGNIKDCLMRLFRGIKGLDFECSAAENYFVSHHGTEIALIYDLPEEEFRSASVLKRKLVRRGNREAYDQVVRRLKEENYVIHRSDDLDLRLKTVI